MKVLTVIGTRPEAIKRSWRTRREADLYRSRVRFFRKHYGDRAARLLKLQIYGWTEHVVYTGDEHHDGAQVVDIDGDGDLDIISIGWSHDRVLLYENKAIKGGGTPTVWLPSILKLYWRW